MRIRWGLGLALIGLLTVSATSQAQADPRELIQQAIDAHGGAERLTKFPAGRILTKGSMRMNGIKAPFTSESFFHLPDREKVQLTVTILGQPARIGQRYNQGKLRVTLNGQQIPLEDRIVREMQHNLALRQASTLVPLLKAPYQLDAADAIKVDGQPADGVKVTGKDFAETRLYFDRKTHRLVKFERQAQPETGEPAKQEVFLRDYKEIGGVQRPMKTTVLVNGKVTVEGEIIEYQDLEKVDSKEFAVD
jgi:hypothetical protein